METNQYLRIGQAAAFLGLPKSRLYDMTFKRAIPFYKVGSTVLFKPDELERFIESRRVEVAR